MTRMPTSVLLALAAVTLGGCATQSAGSVQQPPDAPTVAAKPLFRDPVFDGAADPVVIWNPHVRRWWMFYTNRRANVPGLSGVAWVHGTRVGLAESADGGATWSYLGTVDIDLPDTFGASAGTHWAPDVITAPDGTHHMFLTVVPGVFENWNHPRDIVHLTSRDLRKWDYRSTLELSADRVIDACVYRLPGGRGWRLWYNNERDAKSIYYADSPDLHTWTNRGKVTSINARGEGPYVFQWKGRYWMLVDTWRGIGVYRSTDLGTWEQQPSLLLDRPGRGADDGVNGGHPGVVVSGDRAYCFYFTHPGRAGTITPQDPGTLDTRRSSIQVVELFERDGWLTADRDAPTTIALASPETSPVVPRIPPIAAFFSLRDVTLGPGPFADARARNAAHLLSLDPDRLLHGFLANAGLEPRARKYGGWESRGLAGHTLGHYLTALAWMVEATGERVYREKLEYTVAELARCQTEARGGLISAIPGDAKIFGEIAAGDIRARRFDLNDGWVPWYNLHKLFAGLLDAHVHGGSVQALAVLRRLADWAERTTGGLDVAQFQRMLYAEHGGMTEVLADLYAITGDERYLRLARRFCDREILEPLARGEDRLNGFHANTQIPKLVGAARLHQLTGDEALGAAAETFWRVVVRDRTWVTGGNSEAEHFFPPEENGRRLTHSTAETCNTYNMLRLTEQLFARQPTAARFEYFERALYNHILASIDPDTGQCTYFVSLRPGFFKYYGDAENAFWCCTGTGLENHAKYERGIYARAGDDTLFVNLFIPSTLQWRARGVRLEQRTRFPEEPRSEFTVRTPQPAGFTLKLRIPLWLAGPADVRVNGSPQPAAPAADGYVPIAREWRDGDTVTLSLPMALRTEALAHADGVLAVLYGPLVLAGELGRGGLESIDLHPPGENQHRGYVPPPAPVLVADSDAAVLDRIERVPGRALTWRTRGLARPADVTLVPFHALHYQRHVVYWTRLSAAAWAAEEARRRAGER
jgi:uncharacterized protein